MNRRTMILVNSALAAVGLRIYAAPWPSEGQVPIVDLIALTDPTLHATLTVVFTLAPGLAVLLCGLVSLSV